MKKMKIFSLVLAFAAILPALRAQENTAAPSSAPAASAVVTPERGQFDEKLTAYKGCLKKLRELKADYQTAEPQQKDKIRAEFDPLLAKAETIQKDLVPLALAAFKSAKGQDLEVANFLYTMIHYATIKENYETAYDISKVILADKIPDQVNILYAFAAYSAFCTMNLEDAEKWFKLADSKGVVEKADADDSMHIRSMLENALPMYKKYWSKEQEIRAKEAGDQLPRVRLKTTKGDIVLELFKNEAPNAVGNFLTLVSKKFYTDVPFHRVLPYFMAQGGDPTGTGTGGPGYCIPCECHQDKARMHFRGSISMAHAGMDTGGSQFFLTFGPTFFLNNKHTVFGRVIEGMDVLASLQRIDPEKEGQPAPDKILEATIERGAPFDFKKLPSRR